MTEPRLEATDRAGDPPGGPRQWPVLRPEHLYRAAGLAFLLALLFRYWNQLTHTLLLMYAAATLAVLFSAAVHRLQTARRGVVALIGLAISALLGALLWLGLPELLEELRDLAARAPQYERQLAIVTERLRRATGLNIQLVGEGTAATFRSIFLGGSPNGSPGAVPGGAGGVLGALVVPLVILFGALFATAHPNDRLLVPLLRIVPRKQRAGCRRVLELLGVRLEGWLRGSLVCMLAVGVLNAVALGLIGVPNALLLGMVNGLLEFIPLLGPWIGGGIATFVALLDAPSKAIWTIGAVLAIQQIENNVIVPWAMPRSAQLHPFVSLFALVLFGGLFGFLGLVLAIPLALLLGTVLQVFRVEHIDVEQ